MAEERERVVPPEAPRRTMYQLLHPTQSSIPSCIMFPPNAPHVDIKQRLMAILPNFRGLENENPYVHVRAFEEVIGSFYAQNVIEIAKLRFFPFSILKDKTKGSLYTMKPRDRQFVQVACGGGFLKKEPEDAMDYLDEIAENSNTWNGPSPLDSTDRNKSSTTTSGGSVFRLRERDNMSAKINLLTKEIEALKLRGSRGVNAVYREEPKEACQICQEIDHTPSASNEKSKETPTEKDESGIAKSNDIEKCPFPAPFPQALKLPKNLDVTSEILEHLHQVKVNLPLLHIIKQMPLYAKVIKDLCTVKRKYHVKKTAFLIEQMLKEEQVVEAKKPPRSKKKFLHAYPDAPKLKLKQPPRDLPCASIEPHATSTMEVPSKMSVDQEIEKEYEKTKFFETAQNEEESTSRYETFKDIAE
uniref:Uncharacterized protein n=1 Tax=Fagus sylvatica TaxID=28930 RepID=A0A2N9GVE2_FAGSY